MNELLVTALIGIIVWAVLSAVRSFIRFFIELYYFIISKRKLSAVETRIGEGSISSFEGWMRKGDIYFGIGNNETAIDCYRKAGETHPLNKTAPFRLGLALFLDDHYRGIEVEEALCSALDKDSDYVDAHFILGQFYLDLGLFSRARDELSRTPEKIDVQDMDFLFKEEDEKGLGERPFHYRNINSTSFRVLMVLYLLQLFLLGTIFFTGLWWILPANILLLLLQLKLHVSVYENLVVQEEALVYHTAFRSITSRWNEIRNLVRENESRFRIILKDRDIRINRHWQNFEDIVRKLKVQLYFQKWRPQAEKKSCG
jgi:tetratricopeptide (TPR) repeat protein